MEFPTLIDHIFDSGRTLSAEEREALEHLYPWPRPDKKLCQRETNNDHYRLGRK